MKKYFLLALLFIGGLNGLTQKANLKTVEELYTAQQYQEAYEVLNNPKFKLKEGEHDKFYYYWAVVGYQLYIASPELNSEYRNWAVSGAAAIDDCDDASLRDPAIEIMNYLTATIFQDIHDFLYENAGPDSLHFNKVSVETLESLRYFVIPAEWTNEQLTFVGTMFYNEASYIEIKSHNPMTEDEKYELSYRYRACAEIAWYYFRILCVNHELECEAYKLLCEITYLDRVQ